MSKVVINESTLTTIGDAIRSKTNTSDLIAPGNMAAMIEGIVTGGGGEVEVEPVVLTGDCQYACAGAMASKYIKMYGDTVSTNDITNASNMFYKSQLSLIPFDINILSTNKTDMSYMFYKSKLIELPKVYGAQPSDIQYLFNDCAMLRTIPEDWMDTWNFTAMSGAAYARMSYMFNSCRSLRTIPVNILTKLRNDKTSSSSYKLYYGGFSGCRALDELVELPVDGATVTSNMFYSTFSQLNRVKNILFETNEDGSAKTANWKGQTIDINNWTGYIASNYSYLMADAGITADKEVTDDATYQALKNDPDWFTANEAYSRYNHDSAVATINSLPDTSAYLAEKGGTNTIKFKGAAGEKTEGGAINTLTEEEIAVATSRGWTVTLI